MMSGFRHDNRKTLERFSSDGWFKTGDLGSITENRLSISGRADDQIISGGIKVDPDSVARLIAGQYQELDFAICATPHLELGYQLFLLAVSGKGFYNFSHLLNCQHDLRVSIKSQKLILEKFGDSF